MIQFRGSLSQLVEYIRRYPSFISEIMSLFESYDLNRLREFFDRLDIGRPYIGPPIHAGYLRYHAEIDQLLQSRDAYCVDHTKLDQEYVDPERTISAYSRTVEIFDDTVNRFLRPPRREAISCLSPQPGEKILEFGIGPGSTFEYYPKHCSVLGIDLSRRSVEAAKAKCEKLGIVHIRVEERDIQSSGLPEDSFDAVFGFCALCVVSNPFTALQEIRRLMKKDARLVLYEPGFSALPEVNTLLYLIQPIARVFGNIWFTGFPAYTILYNSCLDLDGLLKATGFTAATVRWYDSPFNTVRLLSCRKAG